MAILPQWLREKLRLESEARKQLATQQHTMSVTYGVKPATQLNPFFAQYAPPKPKSAFEYMKETKTGMFSSYKVDVVEPYRAPVLEACWPTGSRYICSPPPVDTDDDTIILVDELPLVEGMESIGWKLDVGKSDNPEVYTHAPDYGIRWVSYRKGIKNLIYTNDRTYYIKFVAATELAKKMNLVNKADRVKLFQIVSTFDRAEKNDPVPNRGFI